MLSRFQRRNHTALELAAVYPRERSFDSAANPEQESEAKQASYRGNSRKRDLYYFGPIHETPPFQHC